MLGVTPTSVWKMSSHWVYLWFSKKNNDHILAHPTSACSTPYTLQAGTVQRSDQHKQQGVSYASKTSRNTGLYNTSTPIIHTRRSSHILLGQGPHNFYETPTPWSANRDLVRHWLTKSMIASWTLNGACSLGAPTHPRDSVYKTTGDTWRTPARRLRKTKWPLVYRKQTTKKKRLRKVRRTPGQPLDTMDPNVIFEVVI